MLYFLYGDDTKTVSEKANTLVAGLLKKKPDASFFTLTEENWIDSVIEEYLVSQGLFENKYVVLVKNIFAGNKERKEDFLKRLDTFAESPNIFIVVEGGVDKASLKKIEKYAEKVQDYSTGEKAGVILKDSKGGAKDEFKIFALTDALGARDKKALWTLYRKAVELGKVPEEIHGILFWQVKSMVLAARSKSAGEAGLNPFVYGKAKRYAENYSGDELKAMLEKLVTIYHDSHRGVCDFETAMEIFLLGI